MIRKFFNTGNGSAVGGDTDPMQKLIDDQTKEIQYLKEQLKGAEAISNQFASQQNEIDSLKAELENSAITIAELKEELEEKQKQIPGQLESFEYEGKKYEILVKAARIPGLNNSQPLTAIDMAKDEDAIKKLVTSGSGLIREVK